MGVYGGTPRAFRSDGLFASMCAPMPHAVGALRKGSEPGLGGALADLDLMVHRAGTASGKLF